jgi:hypothetical protein
MNREEERSPPSPRCECWENLTDRDTEGHRCGTTCFEVYHSEIAPVRSAEPLTDWMVSPYQACPECSLSLLDFPHTRCGE